MNSMTQNRDESIRLLLARLDDLCAKGGRGEMGISPFLTPREAKYAARHLAARIAAGTALLYGGYPDAERVRAVILPDYAEGRADRDRLTADPVAALREAGLEELADSLRSGALPLLIRGSGFRELNHRDYLGSVLGLGLERSALGDLVVADAHHAYLYTSASMGDFLVTQLVKVATDTVKTLYPPADSVPTLARRLQPISDTVASERLDCVVAALCNLSREKAQTAIRSGLVELDYELTEACDAAVEPPAVLSVRGFGKYAVHRFDGETRKGRIRLVAGKYI